MTSGDRGLRVDRVRLVPGGGALAAEVGDARRRWAVRRGVLVAIEAGGVVGLGEASPLPGVSLEDVASAAGALAEVAPRLEGATVAVEPGADPLDVVDRSLDRLGSVWPASARFALETALLDVLGQRRGQPLATLLGARPGARVEVSALLGDPGAEDAASRAARLVEAGARTLKLKLGSRPVEADVAAVSALRRALGPGPALVGDANGAWSIAAAREAATALAPLGVLLLEQPVAPSELGALGATTTATWADESLTAPGARAAVLALPHVAGVVLKPTVLGGIAPARAIAREAAQRGKGAVVTHALEGPVALRACAALALALASAEASGPARAGLWAHAGLAAWPAVGVVPAGPELTLDPRAGLGLDPHERAALLDPARGAS